MDDPLEITGEQWLDSVYCQTGEEKRLNECYDAADLQYECKDGTQVRIACSASEVENPYRSWGIRLETKVLTFEPQFEGRVEVFNSGKWGSVCKNWWFMWSKQAQIVCRQLGMVGGMNLGNSLTKANKDVRIWLDKVWCKGTEKRLDECWHRGWGRHTCGHFKDVSVRCTLPTDNSHLEQ